MRRGATPLSEPTLTYISWIRPSGTNFSEILIKTQEFSYKKIIWKYLLRNGSHFVSASVCWKRRRVLFWRLIQHPFLQDGTILLTRFHQHSNSMQTSLRCNSMSCATICSDQFIWIWTRAKLNFHQIWIVIEKLLVKWVPGRYYFKFFLFSSSTLTIYLFVC